MSNEPDAAPTSLQRKEMEDTQLTSSQKFELLLKKNGRHLLKSIGLNICKVPFYVLPGDPLPSMALSDSSALSTALEIGIHS